MSESFLGEIRMFAGNFAPAGWTFCNGDLLAISENDALFNLIGTTYGGDGQSTFGLPDLRGRVPIHQGNDGGHTYVLAQSGGAEQVLLNTNQIAAHNHVLLATTTAAQVPNVANALPATGTISQLYWGDPPDSTAAPQAIGNTGGGQPHSNFQPYLCINFIISLSGIFPSQQ